MISTEVPNSPKSLWSSGLAQWLSHSIPSSWVDTCENLSECYKDRQIYLTNIFVFVQFLLSVCLRTGLLPYASCCSSGHLQSHPARSAVDDVVRLKVTHHLSGFSVGHLWYIKHFPFRRNPWNQFDMSISHFSLTRFPRWQSTVAP